MPPQDRGRLNDLDRTEQDRPQPGHPYQQRAIAAPQRQTSWSVSQSDVELMTEKKDLGFKPPSRLNRSATTLQASGGSPASNAMML